MKHKKAAFTGAAFATYVMKVNNNIKMLQKMNNVLLFYTRCDVLYNILYTQE